MNTRKFSLKDLLLSAALAIGFLTLSAGHACAQTYGTQTIMNGGTNNVAGVTTNTYYTNAPAYLIDVTGKANVAISVAGSAVQSTNATTQTFNFAQSLDGTTNTTETTPTWTINLKLNGTTWVTATTNITVNAVGYLYLYSIGNPSATSTTNLTVNYSLKANRSLY